MRNRHFDKKFIPAKYLNRFLSWNSAANMLELNLFPNIKEIAESMSMFYAVEEKLMKWDTNIIKKSDNIHVIVVGDGNRPRTGCVFAFNTNWNVISIDPLMKPIDYSSVRHLTVIKDKIENLEPLDFGDDIVIVVMPHSHAPIDTCWNKYQSTRKWLIKLECCTHDKLDFPYYAYRDTYAITQANNVFIWNNYLDLNFTNQANGGSL